MSARIGTPYIGTVCDVRCDISNEYWLYTGCSHDNDTHTIMWISDPFNGVGGCLGGARDSG